MNCMLVEVPQSNSKPEEVIINPRHRKSEKIGSPKD